MLNLWKSWNSPRNEWGWNPGSVMHQVCDIGQVTSALCAFTSPVQNVWQQPLRGFLWKYKRWMMPINIQVIHLWGRMSPVPVLRTEVWASNSWSFWKTKMSVSLSNRLAGLIWLSTSFLLCVTWSASGKLVHFYLIPLPPACLKIVECTKIIFGGKVDLTWSQNKWLKILLFLSPHNIKQPIKLTTSSDN